MYQLEVQNMTCGHCAATVTKAVKAIDSAATVNVDLAAKTVAVSSSAPLEVVRAVIAEAGYPVTKAG
ncbi:heavy-metal-associated domain-containing protein [Massilia sp. SM-13]|uniref:heavy-metal-associated domain-containing protein n=1 Tax=Pseudoduganella rhizocola TaxID=3382643 RepID=UPI0038B4B095